MTPRVVGILGLPSMNARKLEAKNNESGKNGALTTSRTLTALKNASGAHDRDSADGSIAVSAGV